MKNFYIVKDKDLLSGSIIPKKVLNYLPVRPFSNNSTNADTKNAKFSCSSQWTNSKPRIAPNWLTSINYKINFPIIQHDPNI